MREASDRQLWAWIVGEAAAERLAGVPLSRIERLGNPDLLALVGNRPRIARAARAIAELGRRFSTAQPSIGKRFRSGRDVARVYRPRIGHEEREYCYVLALDAQHRLLREALVGVGGSSRVAVDPRDVFTPVLRERADGAIVIHNHPAGDPAPSAADRAVAARLQRARRSSVCTPRFRDRDQRWLRFV